jgi:O-antigen/teichoic acid export membrane protein
MTGRAPHAPSLVRVGRSTLISQGFSSLSNFLLAAVVARSGGEAALGVVALFLTVYLVALGAGRVLISEPVLAERGSDADGVVGAGEGVSLTLLLSACLAAASFVAWLVSDASWLLMLAVGLPPLLLHDYRRYLAFRRESPGTAIALDALWVVGFVAAFPLLESRLGVAEAGMLAWVIGATLGLAAVPWQRTRSVHSAWRWWTTTAKPYALGLGAESIVYTATSQAAMMVAAAIAGVEAFGRLRGALTLAGPLAILATTIGLVLTPYFVRLEESSAESSIRRARTTARLALAALAVVGVIAVAFTSPLASVVLGDEVQITPLLLALLVIMHWMNAASAPRVSMLKSQRRSGVLARLRTASGLVTLLLVVALAAPFGATGMAAGLTAGAAGMLLLLWHYVRYAGVEGASGNA